MPIQVERAVLAIRHELGASLSSGMTALEVVELAYQALFSMKEGWFWAMRTVELTPVAGESTIRLPADFGNMYRPADGDWRIIVLPDKEYYAYKAAGVVQSSQTYICRMDEDDDGWYLEFIEPFSDDISDDEDDDDITFFINYEAGAVAITDAEQTLPLPMYMHLLFLAVTRAIARGFEESDEVSVEALLFQIQKGPTFDQAVKADLRKRPRSVNSLARRIAPIGPWPWDNTTAPVISTGGVEHWPS